MKRIILTWHAKRRIREPRQQGIEREDVFRACYRAREILYKPVPEPLELKNFIADSGRIFNIVVVDVPEGLRVITIIGLFRKGEPLYENE